MKQLALATLGFLVLTLPDPLGAATAIHVDDDNATDLWNGTAVQPHNDIQRGTDDAADDDTVLVHDGKRGLDFCGKAVALESASGLGATAFDCEGIGCALYMHSAETDSAVIDGVTTRNGNAFGGWAKGCGAGILYVDSDLAVGDCVPCGDTTRAGAGMLWERTMLTVDHRSFTDNSSLSCAGVTCWDYRTLRTGRCM